MPPLGEDGGRAAAWGQPGSIRHTHLQNNNNNNNNNSNLPSALNRVKTSGWSEVDGRLPPAGFRK